MTVAIDSDKLTHSSRHSLGFISKSLHVKEADNSTDFHDFFILFMVLALYACTVY